MDGGRWGFSTGACAAAASKAAALAAGHQALPESVAITLPDGRRAELSLAWARAVPGGGEAAVVKDAGDDPDVSHGAMVIARVMPAQGWIFEAGEGVGTVTRPGLQIPPGEAAINPWPRRMIRAALQDAGWEGARIRVSIPGGAELAQRTFNPRLGVAGGLSILGTTGRVRPFSLEAVRATIACALDVARAEGHETVALVPGHLGERALRAWMADLAAIEVSNAWGCALELAEARGFKALLLAGHPGKLVKLSEGYFDTHSSRSPSPLPKVRALAEAFTARRMEDTPTVEGVFQTMDPDERRIVAEHLAREVARAAQIKSGLPCGVLLTDMAGGVYGGGMEGTPWA